MPFYAKHGHIILTNKLQIPSDTDTDTCNTGTWFLEIINCAETCHRLKTSPDPRHTNATFYVTNETEEMTPVDLERQLESQHIEHPSHCVQIRCPNLLTQ